MTQGIYLDRRTRVYRNEVMPWLVEQNVGELLGQGVFSAVYATPSSATVLKVTKDWPSIGAVKTAKNRFPDDPHLFPQGRFVGRISGSDSEPPYYGVYLERLRPVRATDACMRWALVISRRLSRACSFDEQKQALLELAMRSEMPAKLGLTLIRLASMMQHDEELRLDLHLKNMMVRDATGELVLSDPFIHIDYT